MASLEERVTDKPDQSIILSPGDQNIIDALTSLEDLPIQHTEVYARGNGAIVLKGMVPGVKKPVVLKAFVPRHPKNESQHRARGKITLHEAIIEENIHQWHTIPVVHNHGEISVQIEGEERIIPYSISDYVGRCNLAEYVAEKGPLRGDDLLEFIDQMTRTVKIINEQGGVIIRDLTPNNIRVDDKGRLTFWVVDFDASTAVNKESYQYEGTYNIGGRYVTPPEAIAALRAGKEWYPDARADVFGLGTLIYYATTGRMPFIGKGENPDRNTVHDRILALDEKRNIFERLSIMLGKRRKRIRSKLIPLRKVHDEKYPEKPHPIPSAIETIVDEMLESRKNRIDSPDAVRRHVNRAVTGGLFERLEWHFNHSAASTAVGLVAIPPTLAMLMFVGGIVYVAGQEACRERRYAETRTPYLVRWEESRDSQPFINIFEDPDLRQREWIDTQRFNLFLEEMYAVMIPKYEMSMEALFNHTIGRDRTTIKAHPELIASTEGFKEEWHEEAMYLSETLTSCKPLMTALQDGHSPIQHVYAAPNIFNGVPEEERTRHIQYYRNLVPNWTMDLALFDALFADNPALQTMLIDGLEESLDSINPGSMETYSLEREAGVYESIYWLAQYKLHDAIPEEFNRLFTISWQALEHLDEIDPERASQLRSMVEEWLEKEYGSGGYVVVREVSPDAP